MSNSVCILINSCPKYNSLALACCKLIKRYAPDLKWPIYFASAGLTEEEKGEVSGLGFIYMEQTASENADFIESRLHALRLLQKDYRFVLLLQDDFFLDRQPDYAALEKTVAMMTENPAVVCTRLMPCPGPTGPEWLLWRDITVDPYCYFSFQAGIWSTEWLIKFFEGVVRKSQGLFARYPQYSRNQFWLLVNPCETEVGTDVAVELGGRFVGWPRLGRWSNAVYLSPWPYRPTAVEKGVLQPWASEMLKREGYSIH